MSDSSLVYQGYGRGLDKELLSSISAWAMCDRKPDITIYIDIPYDIAHARIMQRNELTVFEKEHEHFTKKLIQGFKEIAAHNRNSISLDGTCDEQQLVSQAFEKIIDHIKKNNLII